MDLLREFRLIGLLAVLLQGGVMWLVSCLGSGTQGHWGTNFYELDLSVILLARFYQVHHRSNAKSSPSLS